MKVYGHYRDETNEFEELCFVCAVKRIVEGGTTNIYFETDDDEYNSCASCGEFIKDSVEI